MTAPSLTIAESATALRKGAVIAYPTEAVWGLGCDPFNEAAVRRLLAIKQRDIAKGLILIAGEYAQLEPLVDWSRLPGHRAEAVRASWPGPHTWVMPTSARMPDWIRGSHAGGAVRLSAHPIVIALCAAFGGPLVSTSANLSGQPPAFVRDQLDDALLDRIDGVSEGETGGLAAPSTIRDAMTGDALRV